MTLAHQDIRERLVDYLCGELDEPARAAFDEHLAGCESCRATVEETAKARAMAREVVRAPLDEPIPLGVRSRVLAAAAAAAEERRTAASSTTVAAAAAAAIAAAGSLPSTGGAGAARSGAGDGRRDRAESPRRGWLDWLRGRWAFPTLATVAAMAAFFLVRGTILREARHPLDDETVEKLGSPGAGPATGSERGAQVPAARDQEKSAPKGEAVEGQLAPAPEAKVPADGKRPIADQPGRLGKEGAAAPVERARRIGASSGAVRRAAGGDALDGLGELDWGRRSEREEGASRAPKRVTTKSASPAKDSLSGAVRRERAPQKAEASLDEPSGFATPPPILPPAPPSGGAAASVAPAVRSAPDPTSAAAEPPSPAPTEARQPAAPRAGSERDSDKKAKESKAVPAGRAGEAPAAERAQDDEAAVAADRAPAPAPRPASATRRSPATSAAGSAAPAAPDPARAPAQRADQLLAARRWTEASAAYRDLLRRFPDHPSAAQWRTRLAAADQAAAGVGTSGFATPPPPR